MTIVAWCERCSRVLHTLSEAGHYGSSRCCPNPRCAGALRYVGVDYAALARPISRKAEHDAAS